MAWASAPVRTCPRCKSPVTLPATGTYECPRCRASFEFLLPNVLPPAYLTGAIVPPRRAEGSEEPACAYHANNVAAGVCERCGDFTCILCATPTEGRSYCTRCFDALFQRGSLQVAQQQFTLPQTAYTLSLIALLLFCAWYVAIPLGIAGIVLGIKSLRQIARQPDLPGRGKAIAAIVIGCLALLVLAGVVFGIFASSLR